MSNYDSFTINSATLFAVITLLGEVSVKVILVICFLFKAKFDLNISYLSFDLLRIVAEVNPLWFNEVDVTWPISKSILLVFTNVFFLYLCNWFATELLLFMFYEEDWLETDRF